MNDGTTIRRGIFPAGRNSALRALSAGQSGTDETITREAKK
jgi:hypothetical protein